MNKKMYLLIMILLLAFVALPRLKAMFQPTNSAVQRVNSEEAKKMMAELDNYIILDVRTMDEYASGHIPGAICIPNEQIFDQQPKELPDLNQHIFVYCRSGNRSRQAASKLANMGYQNIVDFGGIGSWSGPIEK